MSVRKHNEYLDGGDSEDELHNGSDSEEQEESRGVFGKGANKRRKFDADSDDESFDEFEEEKQEAATQRESLDHAASTTNGADEEEQSVARPKSAKSLAKPSTPKQVAAAEKAARKSGVLYISRVPPFMKPSTLKHFLSPHAPSGLGRIFLTPEDHGQHTRRVKSGGNKKKSFTDGWVEFVSKKEAKMAAEVLNGNIIGGKKGNFYHDDLWNLKFLKGVKWAHLDEQLRNENAERVARLREEVRRTRTENKKFAEDFERGKMMEGRDEKRKAKGQGQDGEAPAKGKKPMTFTQSKVKGQGKEQGRGKVSNEVTDVLKGIFS